MDCTRALEWIGLDAYGELDAEEKVLLDAHLHDCGSCAEERVLQDELVAGLQAWELPALEPRRIAPSPARRRWPAAMIGAAASLLVFALLCFVGTEVRRDSGGLTLRFGASSPGESALPGADRDEVFETLGIAYGPSFDETRRSLALERGFDALARQQAERLRLMVELLRRERSEELQLIVAGLLRDRALNDARDEDWQRRMNEILALIRLQAEQGRPLHHNRIGG